MHLGNSERDVHLGNSERDVHLGNSERDVHHQPFGWGWEENVRRLDHGPHYTVIIQCTEGGVQHQKTQKTQNYLEIPFWVLGFFGSFGF